MDTELKCNRLTCRKTLTDKAVVVRLFLQDRILSVLTNNFEIHLPNDIWPSLFHTGIRVKTTCSHIFCVECANELFNAARLCPACESSLSEPDDVVICSLHPSNDYKTSVLSGLTPSIILEICSRAIAFWQYQIHQENSFQHAVLRNLNDKNSQLQKQLDNVVREANGEINLLNNKVADLERDVEVERRKVRDLQEATREREKEYQKLKTQHDRVKRKALLGPNAVSNDASMNGSTNQLAENSVGTRNFGANVGTNVDYGAVAGGMELNGIQRTPIVNRLTNFSGHWGQHATQNQPQQRSLRVGGSHRQPLVMPGNDRPHAGGYVSDRSDSANEVEQLLVGGGGHRQAGVSISTGTGGWNPGALQAVATRRTRPAQRVFAPPGSAQHGSGTFRPAISR